MENIKDKAFHHKVCKLEQGAACCRHLVSQGLVLMCNKLVAPPAGFEPFPDAAGDNCPGVKDLAGARMETARALCKEIYNNLKVVAVNHSIQE
ncbi:MAG: hypothetical protein V4478_01220 [Patescibacteria group bacterium]